MQPIQKQIFTSQSRVVTRPRLPQNIYPCPGLKDSKAQVKAVTPSRLKGRLFERLRAIKGDKMTKTSERPIVIVVGGTVVPKERPQIEGSNNNARYSPAYTQWMKSAKLALQASIAALPATVTQHFPLTGVRVEIEFHGSLHPLADLDNSGGAWEDVMVRCGIISGDSVRKVNEVNFKFFEAELPMSAIIIYPNWVPVSVIAPKLLREPKTPTTVKLAKTAVKEKKPQPPRKTPVKTAAAKKPQLTIVKTPKK